MKPPTSQITQEDDFNLKDVLNQYLKFWPWFILSVVIFVSISILYVRYSTYIYQSQATILIKDSNNSALSELAAFEDLGLGGGGLSKSDFENEIEIIKSKRLISQVVDDFQLNVKYYREGNVKSSEVFKGSKFTVGVKSLNDSLKSFMRSVYIRQTSGSTYEIKVNEDSKAEIKNYGTPQSLDFGQIVVFPNKSY